MRVRAEVGNVDLAPVLQNEDQQQEQHHREDDNGDPCTTGRGITR
jgi:hypothetical protein